MNLTNLRSDMHEKLWRAIYEGNSMQLNTGNDHFSKVFHFNFITPVWSGMS